MAPPGRAPPPALENSFPLMTYPYGSAPPPIPPGGYLTPGPPPPNPQLAYGPPPGSTTPKWGQRAVVALPVLAVCMLASGLAWWRFDPGPFFPSEWDDRVAPLIDDVERLRGLNFDHPVPVYFLEPEEYSNLSRNGSVLDDGKSIDSPEPTREERESNEIEVASSRALGVLEGSPDLDAASEELQDTGSLAYYDPTYRVINVRGTELTTELNVTLVHELTHALQDQHFDLNQIGLLSSEDEYSAFRALVEGDAVSIENQYLLELPEADQEAYFEDARAGFDEASEDLAEVPSILQSTFAFYYVVGNPFVDSIGTAEGTERDNELINRAFEDPPASSQELMHAPSYLEDSTSVTVDPPEVTDGEVVSSGPYGAGYFFIMLSERIDPVLAMHAVDQIAGDNVVIYEKENGDICASAVMRVDDESELASVVTAFGKWAAAMPSQANATVDADDTDVRFSTCDPGADAEMGLTNRSTDAIYYPATRLDIYAGEIFRGAPAELAWCFADIFVTGLTLEQLVGEGEAPDIAKLSSDASDLCSA